MTDFFLLLMIAGAGDELQGIKRGIIEMLDGMVINKADGDNKARAERDRAEYARALRLFPPDPDGWIPQVLTCSALENTGIAEVWQMVRDHHSQQTATGCFEKRRRAQTLDWMHQLIDTGLNDMFREDTKVQSRLPELARRVQQGEVSTLTAAQELLNAFRKG